MDYLDDCGKESGRLQKEPRVPCGCRKRQQGLGDPAQEDSGAKGRPGFHPESCEVTGGWSKDRGRTVSVGKTGVATHGGEAEGERGGWKDGFIRGWLEAWLTVMAMGVPGDSPASRRVLKGTEGAGLLLDCTGNERGAPGTERAWSIPGRAGGGGTQRRAAIRGCVLSSDASWGLRGRRGEAVRDTPGSGRDQCGQRPEPWDSAAACRVRGEELKDPSATAGGTSEKPWGAENVISPLGMPPLRQEAQRLFNSRHDETVRLTRSRVRSHEGRSSVGHLCKEAALFQGFLGRSAAQNPPTNAGAVAHTRCKTPWRRNGSPLQYSC